MAPVPYTPAARVREILALAGPDAPAPSEVQALVRRLAQGTAFESWFSGDAPCTRELMVICGQLAASRPGGGLAEALANLAADCRSSENTLCPDRIVSVYEALAAAVPKFGPCPPLRSHIRSPGWFFPGMQEISVLAAAAAGLMELGEWDESIPRDF